MKVPLSVRSVNEWHSTALQGWVRLVQNGSDLEKGAGRGNAFEEAVARLRHMAHSAQFSDLRSLLSKRTGARALTWLWLHDEASGPKLFNLKLLDSLVEAQEPRLSRLTLIQLIQLYLKHFDHLDAFEPSAGVSLSGRLRDHILDQLWRLPDAKQPLVRPDIVSVLKREGEWLLAESGPLVLVKQVRESGGELADALSRFGLDGFDNGRYGDVCRAHFYLETLRVLAPGEKHAVFDELSKPSVNRAPYEGGKRIGHEALAILIDRGSNEPGQAWQDLIINMAGDPRIASTATNYREWWLPLGEERIAKVRSWLSKEDLKLFLQAVEQYGKEAGKDDLQRMFPARRVFLEGLFRLGLIRDTRLLLGRVAQMSVRRILGSELKTSFASMDGTMNDKAVIYLDCGDFHLVEGSHSFKIWAYLAQPSSSIKSYDKRSFTHGDLTVVLPNSYKIHYPGADYQAVTHNGSWQQKVFEFLANNGIALDIEQLLTKQDYKEYLVKHGMPVVNRKTTRLPLAKFDSEKGSTAPQRMWLPPKTEPTQTPRHPVAEPLTKTPPSIRMQNAELADTQSALPVWGGIARNTLAKSRAVNIHTNTEKPELEEAYQRVCKMSAMERMLLGYMARNPGDKVRQIANILDVETRELNQILHGRLKDICTQRKDFGWEVLPDYQNAIMRYETQN